MEKEKKTSSLSLLMKEMKNESHLDAETLHADAIKAIEIVQEQLLSWVQAILVLDLFFLLLLLHRNKKTHN